MIDRDVALEALGTLCNASVASIQKTPAQTFRAAGAPQQLFIKSFIHTVSDADETSEASKTNFLRVRSCLQSGDFAGSFGQVNQEEPDTKNPARFIDENEFFDPKFDYDFTGLKDTETFYRGGEVYERPCGWTRFALRVLDDYEDNRWLGTQYRSTQSCPGEWPVSYHGTSKGGAEGIIEGYYKPGPGDVYGRGIYSTPYIAEALWYAKVFTSKKTGKKYKVILQNRINPEYREKHNSEKYWLVRIPKGTSKEEEQRMVERAIRPYGLLLKEV